jgi:hypothetical protein
MDQDLAARILSDFNPSDRLAIVLEDKSGGGVVQRISTAGRMAAPDFQAWLRRQNDQGHEVYLSLNALHPEARCLTKQDVQTIRHLSLEFDKDGEAAVRRLREAVDLPKPTHIVKTSDDKRQVIWRVEGFTIRQAEDMQQDLAEEMGANLRSIDCARALRLPGFYSHLRSGPYWVHLQSKEAGGLSRLEDFGEVTPGRLQALYLSPQESRWDPGEPLSPAERDSIFAKSALSLGVPVRAIIAVIAEEHQRQVPDPEYAADYARSKVREAAAWLTHEQLRAYDLSGGPER